jgi:catechol 2,3-dioxygenase-like lactoylglutathione lyase family enzyme
VGEISENALCRMATLRDPEGNLVQLVEPREPLTEGTWPRLSHVIVSAKKFHETVAFYRELLGLKLAEEEEHWVEFDTGETRLAVHDREKEYALPLHADQRMAIALEDQDFDAWIEELRKRSVSFAAAPGEGELGPQAEVEDGDGWLVVLRGPQADEPPDEDELDAEYGDDDDEPHGLPRRGGELGSDGGRRPAFNPAKAARKQAARIGKTAPVEPERGGFVPRAGAGGPRPYTPRPAGPPREGAPGGFTPRPPREGATGGFTPRPPGPPREGGARPYTPRPDSPRPSPSREGGARPPRPAGPPKPDRDRTE